MAQRARTKWVYAPGSTRVAGLIRSGWTQAYDAGTGTWSEQQRYLGTFYFTSRRCSGETQEDALGRVLEMHGPCWVDGEDATDCRAGEQVPVTQYHYWAGTETTNRRHQLWKMLQYTSGGVSGCGERTPLVTTFNEYTQEGLPTSVTEPNGVTTQYWYKGTLLMLSQMGSGPQVGSTYFHDKLESRQHPAGNYDVF